MTKYVVFIACCFVISALTGCSGSSESAAILRVGNGAEPQALDPHIVSGVPEHRITSCLFEGLVGLDPKTLKPTPAVALSWDVSDDRTAYTFHLRPEARWSNGDPVTAHDFAYAWRRILSPNLGSEYAYMLFCIENAEAFNKGTVPFDRVGVEAVDDHTLRVRLNAPTPYFLSMQIHYSWYPVHQATIEAFGAIDDRISQWTRPGNFVGNGPFVLETWQPNRVIGLKKSPTYWDAARVKLDGVEFYPIDDGQAEERLFRSGKLHITESLPLSKVPVYEKDHPAVFRNDPYLGTYFYRFNVTRPPLDDARVRRALSLAIDRKSICENVLKGGQQPAGHLTPPDTAGYTCAVSVTQDIEQARQLLAEAGYPDGKGFPSVEVLYNTADNHRRLAEALHQMWKKHLNIEVTLLNQDWKVYLDSMNQLNYDIARSSWIADFIDPINFLECFTTGNGNNRTGYSSPEFDALIEQARQEGDPDKRMALFQKAEALLLHDAPIAPLYFYRRVHLVSEKVKGWQPNALGYVSFKDLSLDNGGA